MNNVIQDSLNLFRSKTHGSLAQRVYLNLVGGLVTVALTAATVPNLVGLRNLLALSQISLIPVFLIPLALRFLIRRLNNYTAYGLFYCYSIAIGTAITPILLATNPLRIGIALAFTGIGFIIAVSSAKRSFSLSDQRTLTTILLVTIGLSILNMFLRLTILELAICALGIPACIACTAYRIGLAGDLSNHKGPEIKRASIILALYVLSDMISLFLYILRLMDIIGGNNRRSR